MKKIRMTGLILLAPLTLLCACSGGVPLSFSANWYRNTALGGSVGDTLEELTYEVTFTPAEDTSGGFSVEYGTGSYTTKLFNSNLTLSDGSTKEGYIYTTELTISGRYLLAGKASETFTDSVKSTVRFLPVSYGLQPVKSEKEVVSTSPETSSPVSLEGAFRTYHYTYDVSYDVGLTTATAVYTDLTEYKTEEGETVRRDPETREYEIEGDTTYLDNEQILFALRGLDLSSGVTFRTINSVMGHVTEAGTSSNTQSSAAVKTAVDFTMDGTAVKQESAARLPLLPFGAGADARVCRDDRSEQQHLPQRAPQDGSARAAIARHPRLYAQGSCLYQQINDDTLCVYNKTVGESKP